MPDTRTIRQYLADLVEAAAKQAVAAGELPDVPLPPAVIERPKDGANGDFATALPLRLARSAMKPPLEVASAIARHIAADDVLDAPEIAAPGFINFRLANAFVQAQVEHVIREGALVR